MRRAVVVVAGAACLGALGASANVGCSGKSQLSSNTATVSSSTADANQGRAATGAAAQATAAAATLAIQAALSAMSPPDFVSVQSPPVVNVSGTTTSGTITMDFGAGTTIANATFSGSLTVSYAKNGSSANVQISILSLSVKTTANGTMTLSGTLLSSITLSGVTASGTITGGPITIGAGSGNSSVTPTLSFNLNGTGGLVTLDGTATVTSMTFESWTVTFSKLSLGLATSPRSFLSGTVTLLRTSGVSVTMQLTFTGANTGTMTVTPPGTTQSFVL